MLEPLVVGFPAPDFEPHLINFTVLPDEEIQGEVVTQLLVLVLKHIFEQGLGDHLDEILALDVMVLPNFRARLQSWTVSSAN